MKTRNFHEGYRHEPELLASERSFGVVFSIFLFLASGACYSSGQYSYVIWLGVLAVGLLVVAILRPKALRPFNWIWAKFGQFLSWIVTPIVLAFLFYVTIVPIGLLMRLSGKDPLRLKFDRRSATYWIARDPPGPPPETMDQQF